MLAFVRPSARLQAVSPQKREAQSKLVKMVLKKVASK
jgi:hypothetical protein